MSAKLTKAQQCTSVQSPFNSQSICSTIWTSASVGPIATGPMRVKEADASFKSQKDRPLASEQAKQKGTGAHRDREKVIKKNKEMNR